MPIAAPRPCTVCRVLVRDGTSRCDQHKVSIGSFADRSRGTRHERGYGTAWVKTRARIMKRDHGLCQVCARKGLVTVATQVDHIVNKASGGSDDDDNLQAICTPCHDAKTALERRVGAGKKSMG